VGYASAVNLSTAERDLLARTEEVTIETTSPTGVVHRTIIWIVVDGDDVYIRSANGAGARWYREAIADPGVAFQVAVTRIPARLVAAADPGSIERCSAALSAKYAGVPGLTEMLLPVALPTTLRVLASE
jgi:hypothetical protein